MKGIVKIEAVYDNIYQEARFYQKITNLAFPGLGDLTFGLKKDYWVAKIIGFDPNFKYKREFIKGKKDYLKSNSKGSRGIFIYYLLESGFIYEVKNNSKRRYFCKVNDDGDIIEISKEEVDQWINEHSE